MDELDEKFAIAAGHAARRQLEREAAAAAEDQRRDGKRRQALADYVAAREQIIELRETLAAKLDYLATQGTAVALDMDLSGLGHAATIFRWGCSELECGARLCQYGNHRYCDWRAHEA